MSSKTAPESHSKPSGDDRNVVPAGSGEVALTFEERVQLMWAENKVSLIWMCVAALAVFVGKEAVFMYLDHRDKALSAAFAAAGKNATQLRTFTVEHPDYGLGWLALADELAKTNTYTEAASAYEKAAQILADTPFAHRAHVGRAMCVVLGGDKTRGEEMLKRLADDPKQMAAARAEASYQLGLLAHEAGKSEDARSRFQATLSMDPQGAWGQRAMSEIMALPRPQTADAPAGASPTPAAGATEIKLNLPGTP